MIAPIIPPTIIQPAEHMPTLVGKSLVTVEATDFDVVSAWVVQRYNIILLL